MASMGLNGSRRVGNPTGRLVMKAAHRAIGGLLPARLLSRRYAGIPGRVHADDLMLQSEAPEHLAHYVSNGQSAIDSITESLALVGRSWADVTAFLDLPSGYGRVTRLLVQHLTPARVTACDLDRLAVRFCVAEFGVQGVVAHRDPAKTCLPSRYDVAFIGSLLTHLPEAAAIELLRAVVAAMAPGGLLLFSTQGESCLEHLDWYGASFKLLEATYRREIAKTGTCFRPYPKDAQYGVTLHARSYIEDLMATRFGARTALIRFAERGWDHHQDVWTFRAAP
jgi:SAM-dependent methyltransferase